MSLFRLIPPALMIPRIMQAKPDTEIIRERIADFSPLIDAAMVAGCKTICHSRVQRVRNKVSVPPQSFCGLAKIISIPLTNHFH